MKTFCKLPWQGLDISSQGEYKPCCKFSTTIATSMEAYRSSKELSKLKESFLLGEKPVQCNRCWSDEAAGKQSKRQEVDNLLTEVDFTDEFKIVGFAFGNICNLACRTCKSSASSKWAVETTKLKAIFPEIRIYPHQKFYKDSTLINQLLDLTKNAVLYEFTGGEPFYSGIAEHEKFLKQLLKNEPSQKTLRYITNATTFPNQEFLNSWKWFKRIDIQLSIDSTGAKFEYLRWPAKWDQVYKNIKKYQMYQADHPNIQLSISHTVSILNVYYVEEFLKWIATENLPNPYLGLVVRPDYFNIATLPDKVKEIISAKLMSNETSSVNAFLLSKHSQSQESMFSKWISEVDKLRNQSYQKTFSEFATILINSNFIESD